LSREDTYKAGAELTHKLVREWRGGQLRFAFPPKEIALIRDLRDVGDRLCRSEGARELVALLIKRGVERTGEAPTAMMLRVSLEVEGHAIDWVSLSELGFKVPNA
jgi:hypothetical protein